MTPRCNQLKSRIIQHKHTRADPKATVAQTEMWALSALFLLRSLFISLSLPDTLFLISTIHAEQLFSYHSVKEVWQIKPLPQDLYYQGHTFLPL